MKVIKVAVFLLILLFVGFLLFPGGEAFSDQVTKLKTYLPLVEAPENEEYKLKPETLTIPEVPAYSPLENRETPLGLSSQAPGFSLRTSYTATEFFQGGVGYVKVEVTNDGENSIFIDRFGVAVNSSKSPIYAQESGVLLPPRAKKNLGIVAVQVPEGNETPAMQIAFWLLAKSQDGKWYEYKRPQFLNEFTLKTSPMPEKINPVYASNPLSLFTTFNELVEASDPEIRKTAAEAAKDYGGAYNIYQVCALFDKVNEEIEYISDPRGNDIWEPANQTLNIGAGDCEDQAILLASLIEAIGGTTRLYLTDTHAFAAVYIGNETTGIRTVVEGVKAYYGNVDVYYTSDAYGAWLMLDPTSSLYAGGLPGTTAQVQISEPNGDSKGWTFLNTSKVKVIDISSNPVKG
ncbi:MAG: transglutaminase family protein [Methanosarcinaceae archaeon]|nr:transglutaminase family protein [Methanosarcinaceae archaeon]MDD4330866.1 transglutaminase family protein [Methanosarcinaceae archaeon]